MLTSAPDTLRDVDLIWWIDNRSACSALVKGATPTEPATRMSLVSHAALASRGVAAYFEWIDSDANPADPLSRLGFDDDWVACQLSCGRWRKWNVTPPPCFGHGPTLLELVFQYFSALGSGT